MEPFEEEMDDGEKQQFVDLNLTTSFFIKQSICVFYEGPKSSFLQQEIALEFDQVQENSRFEIDLQTSFQDDIDFYQDDSLNLILSENGSK